ncbi:phage tail tube protein [Hyphobacterium sp.]|uniref:phage tail tube protein n=1 Tax=Hyphobacterium sp. TaxID=2004662 RepID=UPI003B52EC21
MAQHPTGRQAVMHRLGQLAMGTLASGDYVPVSYFTPFTPQRSQPLEDNPQIGVEADNVLDAQPPAPGLVDARISALAIPLCFNNLGFWLRDIFGDPAAATGADPYTHVWTSGKEALASTLAWAEGAKHRVANSFVGERIEIPFGQQAGFRQVRLSGPCIDIQNEASFDLGTPPSALAAVQAPGAVCGIRKNGSEVARILSGSLTYQRELTNLRYAKADTQLSSGFAAEGASLTGEFELRAIDDTFYDYARSAHTASGVDDWEFEWRFDPASSSNNTFTIAVPALRFEPMERSIDTPHGRTERFRFRGEQTAAAPLVTATLVNSQAAYTAGVESA